MTQLVVITHPLTTVLTRPLAHGTPRALVTKRIVYARLTVVVLAVAEFVVRFLLGKWLRVRLRLRLKLTHAQLDVVDRRRRNPTVEVRTTGATTQTKRTARRRHIPATTVRRYRLLNAVHIGPDRAVTPTVRTRHVRPRVRADRLGASPVPAATTIRLYRTLEFSTVHCNLVGRLLVHNHVRTGLAVPTDPSRHRDLRTADVDGLAATVVHLHKLARPIKQHHARIARVRTVQRDLQRRKRTRRMRRTV